MSKLSKILTSTAVFAVLFLCVDVITAQAQNRSMPDRRGEPIYSEPMPAPSNGNPTFDETHDNGTPPGPPLPPGAPVQTPIDGGLGLLLAAGGAYAIRRMRKRNDEELE